MIVIRDLMEQIFLSADFKRHILQWDGVNIPMKELSNLLGKTYLTIREMQEVVIQTAEPLYTRKFTERLVKILEGIYEKSDLEHIANNKIWLNAEERDQLLRLIQDFESLFDGTIITATS